MKAVKPIIHGRDHAPGGADPIPITAEGLQFNTAVSYGPANVGDWLSVQTTSNATTNHYGVFFENLAGGFLLESSDPTTSGRSYFTVYVLSDDNSGFNVNVNGTGNSGSNFDVRGDNNNGFNVDIRGTNSGGIYLNNREGSNPIQIHAFSANDSGIVVTDDTSAGITISHTHADNGAIELLGTSANQPNPRLVIHSPTSASGDNLFIGDDSRGILFSGGAAPHVQINGGNPSSSSQLTYNIILDAGADTTGSYATNYKNVGVRVTPTLIFGSTDTAPTGSVLGSDTYTSVLFVHNDGTGHPKLKFYCPLTGTTTTIATG